MLIRAGYQISIQCDVETPLMALLSVHPSRAHDLRSPAIITGDHGSPLTAALDEFGNEASLGGRWYTFDARHNRPRIGRVVIAKGRDAADVPIDATFGPSELVGFRVFADAM